MRDQTLERRGAIVACGVAAAIAVLFVVLRPSEDPRTTTDAAPEQTTTIMATTTLAPADQLCQMARRFESDTRDFDSNQTALAAEGFYRDAAELLEGEAHAEFDAAARYYAEYNEIGVEYDYDVFKIAASGKGDRWAQLLFRPPLGIESSRAAVQFACGVDLPTPPTLTTTTTRPRPAPTSAEVPGSSGASGSPGASGSSGPPAPSSPP